MRISYRTFCLLLVLLSLSTLLWGTTIVRVRADVPTVLSINPWTSGGEMILNITVRHSNPSSFHYIDQVDVDKDGYVQSISLSPQSTITFTIQYNLGEVSGSPSVRARAHCTTHGWSGWSSPLVIPEFSSTFIPFILVSTALSVMFARSKLKIWDR